MDKSTHYIISTAKCSSSPITENLEISSSSTAYSNHIQHNRTGSTGTATGDESYITDEEENNVDEADCSIKEHVTSNLYQNSLGSFSDICPEGEKDSQSTTIHRNSSESSLYSDLGLDKCEDFLKFKEQNVRTDMEEWNRNLSEVKEVAVAKLQSELKHAQNELKLKDEQVERLTRIRQEVETELEDLTASLFEEAHNMVRDANVKQVAAEKALQESQMKVDVLIAEVAALKTLVLTSTPSNPNLHLHPQIDPRRSGDEAGTSFSKKHRRYPSHFNLKYGRENSPPESPVNEKHTFACLLISPQAPTMENKEEFEIDPVLYEDFLKWKEMPGLSKEDPFLNRIYEEDINPCLRFNNTQLATCVITAVEAGTIFIEAINDKTKTLFPKKCALLQVPRQCFYRMNIGEADVWYYISRICRNRIIAVCDFLNYLRYIERGLVKSSAHEIYWEITRLRREIALAKLGLTVTSN